MKAICVWVSVLLWMATGCSSEQRGTETTSDVNRVIGNLNDSKRSTLNLDVKEAKKIIDANGDKTGQVTGDTKAFKLFMSTLDRQSLFSIPAAASYVQSFLPKSDPAFRDSTYLYFEDLFYGVVNSANDSLTSLFPDVANHMKENEPEEAVEALDMYLNLFGLELFSSDGNNYLDARADYFVSLFDNKFGQPIGNTIDHTVAHKVSQALLDYLNIRYHEMDEGFSKSGRLLISFKKVHDRVNRWENYLKDYPHSIMKKEATFYYNTYLETLLTGLDNTKVFSGGGGAIQPEVKKLYESIIKSDAKTGSGKIVKGYFDILQLHDFKYADALDTYLASHGLHSMLGRQPHLR